MNQINSLLTEQFPFFKRKNAKKYFISKKKTQRTSKNQIYRYFNWFNEEFYLKHLIKYRLRVRKIEIVDEDECSSEKLIVDIKNYPESPADDLAISIFKQKEMCNLSDHVFQSFINAGANFPSTRFIKECRSHLNPEFKFITNSMGKLIHLIFFLIY